LCSLLCSFSSACLSLSFVSCTTPTLLYPLSLHDALPILIEKADEQETGQREDDPEHDGRCVRAAHCFGAGSHLHPDLAQRADHRSEEHTSELQSRENLVCRLLLEKKK